MLTQQEWHMLQDIAYWIGTYASPILYLIALSTLCRIVRRI